MHLLDTTSHNGMRKYDRVLKDVTLGSSPERIDLVESEIAKAVVRAGEALASPMKDYESVVYHACLRALTEELFSHDIKSSPISASLKAVKTTRRKIGDRFFRKNWLPMESNPDIFNQLGQQLGLPTAQAQFYEVTQTGVP